MTLSKAVVGISIILLAVIISHPLTGLLRKANLPINP
jgi:hypothetical protein